MIEVSLLSGNLVLVKHFLECFLLKFEILDFFVGFFVLLQAVQLDFDL